MTNPETGVHRVYLVYDGALHVSTRPSSNGFDNELCHCGDRRVRVAICNLLVCQGPEALYASPGDCGNGNSRSPAVKLSDQVGRIIQGFEV